MKKSSVIPPKFSESGRIIDSLVVLTAFSKITDGDFVCVEQLALIANTLGLNERQRQAPERGLHDTHHHAAVT